MNIVGIIPARFGSTRFPGKALALLQGKPIVQHVVERAQKAWTLSEIIVATDDPRIAEVTSAFCRTEMTSPTHPSGTDRAAEVASRCKCDGVINIQGDEPLIDPEVINQVAIALPESPMSTAAAPLRDPAEFESEHVVKVVVNARGRALYFSRRPIPCVRDAATQSAARQLQEFPYLKHIGIYGYHRATLLHLVNLPPSSLELAERLEQLRALENGIEITVVQVEYDGVGIDTPEDLRRVQEKLTRAATNL